MAGIGNELTPKFLKAHHVTSSISTVNALRYFHKLMYEFWGFCINGTTDLKLAGGFAPVSGVLFTDAWKSGSAVLLASGSDGVTVSGLPYFTAPSINWTSSSGGVNAFNGKWLVTWKSGSTSTDDSIYPIIQILGSSSIRIDPNCGGTPYPANFHPSFSDRTNVNFRVVDFDASTALAGFTADADGLVLNMDGAYLVNSGQVIPQVRTRIMTSVGANLPNLGLTLSSSGSWTPASSSGFFVDPSTEIQAPATWGGGGPGSGYITLIGAKDFLISHFRGVNWNAAASGFHIEIPQRLYPQGQDPNPIVALNFGATGITVTSATTGYGGGVRAFHPPDGTTRNWRTMIRSLTGDELNTQIYPSSTPGNITNGRDNESFFNIYRNKFIMSDFVLGFPTVAFQFAALRLKMRRVRWTGPVIPTFQRLGDFGEWIHVQTGILWPWDASILPYSLFQAGA